MMDLLSLLAAVLFAISGPRAPVALPYSSQPTPAPYDWRQDWGVETGLSLTPDAAGFDLPTAIAFVPQPGPRPDDPLYYVAELYGDIKVVTNDRTVHTFADDVTRIAPVAALPDPRAETGLGALCLDSRHGYIFATTIYHDDAGAAHNVILRFATTPQVFGLQPQAQVALDGIIDDTAVTGNHQIGGCAVHDGLLYVGIGDSMQTGSSTSPDSLFGKVLRLTLDGQPAPGNPLATGIDPNEPANHVWALGLRNPFGLTWVNDRLFVAENGLSIDRLVEVLPGANYLWNGNDWSIGTRTVNVFAPLIAPAQLAYVPADSAAFTGAFGGSFAIAASVTGPGRGLGPGVVLAPYDWEKRVASAPPRYIVRYRNSDMQRVVAVAQGPDGLYFAPLLPDAGGATQVFKVNSDPNKPHPYGVDASADAMGMLTEKQCLGCHLWNSHGGGIGPDLSPNVLAPRLRERLGSAAYAKHLAALEASTDENIARYREQWRTVAAATGDEQLRLWIAFRLQEPRFDDPTATMPTLGLTEGEARTIAGYLIPPPLTLRQRVYEIIDVAIPDLRYRHVPLLLAAGAAVGALLALLGLALARRFRGARSDQQG